MTTTRNRKRKLEEVTPVENESASHVQSTSHSQSTSHILAETKKERQLVQKLKQTKTRNQIRPPKRLRTDADSEQLQAEVDQDILTLPSTTRHGNKYLWGNGSSSALLPIFSSLTGTSLTPFKQTIKNDPEVKYKTPSGAVPVEKNENGSVVRLKTPGGTDFVRSLKIKITMKSGQTIQIEPFQTVSSAEDKTKEIKVTEKGLQNVEKNCPLPTETRYELKGEVHTPETIQQAAESKHKISSQHKGLRATDIAAFFGIPMVSPMHHSHGHAHRHGQKSLQPVVTDSTVQNSSQESYVTFPAPSKHNYMRVVTVESVNKWIELLGWLSYDASVELFQVDEINGNALTTSSHSSHHGKSIPVIKNETAAWTDRDGNKIEFIFSPHNGVTPAIELKALISHLYDRVFCQSISKNLSGEMNAENSDTQLKIISPN